jgi:ParB family chromosome partitioning protein
MTSGVFTSIAIASVIVNRDERQRKNLDHIEELAASIKENGLINPIVITRDGILVAGERRLTAHKMLGYEFISAQFIDDLEPLQLHLIELEENVRRDDLSWQDHVNAVATYHTLKLQSEPKWSQDQTADALNMSKTHVSRHLMVKQAMDEGVPEVRDAQKLSVAANFAQRLQERRKTAVLRELRQESQPAPAKSADEPELNLEAPSIQSVTRYAEILNTNFTDWAKEVRDQPYNLVHCDFPYGINAGDTSGQSGAKTMGGYDDKPEVYFNLLKTLVTMQDRFIAPSAHLIFWYSMKFYGDTVQILREAGWRVDDFPLVWLRSDNSGIIPDPNRGPRRVYETALFCVRGDRKVVKPIGNAVAAATTKNFHMSEKPTLMLEHFFRMVVDETTVMLDPTCGSGNAVKVAEALGANWSTGLELDPDFAARAKTNLDLD